MMIPINRHSNTSMIPLEIQEQQPPDVHNIPDPPPVSETGISKVADRFELATQMIQGTAMISAPSIALSAPPVSEMVDASSIFDPSAVSIAQSTPATTQKTSAECDAAVSAIRSQLAQPNPDWDAALNSLRELNLKDGFQALSKIADDGSLQFMIQKMPQAKRFELANIIRMDMAQENPRNKEQFNVKLMSILEPLSSQNTADGRIQYPNYAPPGHDAYQDFFMDGSYYGPPAKADFFPLPPEPLPAPADPVSEDLPPDPVAE